MAEIRLNNDNFEQEVLKSEIPVLVDFWATWCGPCMALAPVIEQIAEENEGIIKVGKVDVDEARELAIKYGVVSIPTVFLFKNGEIAGKSIGLVPKEDLEAMFK